MPTEYIPIEREPGEVKFESEKEAFSAGEKFAKEILQEPLLLLQERVNNISEEKNLSPRDMGFIFLDRDARPILHAWRTLTKNKYSSVPMPAGRTQFPGLTEGIGHHNYDYWYGSPVSMDEIRTESDEVIKGWLSYKKENHSEEYHRVEVWKKQYIDTILKKYKDKKLVLIIDIGYIGSLLQMTRYMLEEENPNFDVDMFHLYGGGPSIVPHLAEGKSEVEEKLIPHATEGFEINEETYSYVKNPKKVKIEVAFMKGVKTFFRNQLETN